MGIQVTSTIQPCEDCALEKSKKDSVCKKAIANSNFFGERLIFDISSPSNPTFGGMKHWLRVVKDSINYVWSYCLKKKLDLAGVMMGLIKNLKTKYNIHVQYLHYDYGHENVAFKKARNSLPPLLLNRMTILNRSLLPFSTGYMSCSMVGNSLLS